MLSEEEIIRVLNAVDNLKHKAILMTIYSAGLRISEAINLKIKDIDSQRMQIRVEQIKGKKDRYTLLAAKTLEILRMYVKEYKPKNWLFEGQNGEQYSDRSINAILYQFDYKLILQTIEIGIMPMDRSVRPIEDTKIGLLHFSNRY